MNLLVAHHVGLPQIAGFDHRLTRLLLLRYVLRGSFSFHYCAYHLNPLLAPVGRSLVLVAGAARRLIGLVFAFDRLIVLERAELAVRPGDYLLTFVQTALDLDVVFAGDPGLDRSEDGLVVLDDEDPFDRLLVFRVLILILILRRRRRRRLRA